MRRAAIPAAPPLLQRAAILAAFGIGGIVAVAVVSPDAALQAWLAAAFAWSGVPLGALGLLMLHALAGGSWAHPLSPILRASARTLPLLAAAFLPVIVVPSFLYAWAGPAGADDPIVVAKSSYLNPTFFALRTILCFIVWIVLAWLITASGNTGKPRQRGRLAAGIGVILFSLTVSFTAIDWALSVDPHFSSSAFGLLVGIADLLAAFAFAIPVVAWTGSPRMRAAAGDPHTRQALAGMLAAGILLWAYVSFMQYLVVWSGDVPEQASWYLDRISGAWTVVPWALALLLVLLPLVLLALPAGRASLQRLAGIAALVFVMRFVEALWLVLPSFPYRSWLQPVAWCLAMLGLGSAGFAGMLWLWARDHRQQRGRGAADDA